MHACMHGHHVYTGTEIEDDLHVFVYLYDSVMTTAEEFLRSVENQLLQLVYILAECLSCAATRGVKRLWLSCHCMGIPSLGWRPSKHADTMVLIAQGARTKTSKQKLMILYRRCAVIMVTISYN